jgi:hypothetical protein
MSNESPNTLESYLQKFTEPDWQIALDRVLPSIHEVDRNAVQIWFRFYPLALQQYLSGAPDLEESARSVAIQGDFGLEDRIDTSHAFLYGHRYWKHVKAAIEAEARILDNADTRLSDEIEKIATIASEEVRADTSLLLAISAVGLMTLAQVGLEKFKASRGETIKPKGLMAKSADAIVADRKKDDSQGLFGFLKTVDKKFSVIHNEAKGERFEIMNDQEIASASANDRSQKWQEKDPRCWEGPVPVRLVWHLLGWCDSRQ